MYSISLLLHHATSQGYIQPCATGLSMSPAWQLRSRSSTSLFFSLWKISSAIAPGKKQTLSERSEHKWQNGWEVMKVMEKDGERWKNGTQMALTNGWLLQSKQQMIHLGHCVVRSDFLQKPEDNNSVLSSGKGSIDKRLKIWIAAASIHTSTAYPCVVRHVKTPTAMGMAHPSKTHASRLVHHHDPWVPPKFGQAQGALKNDFFLELATASIMLRHIQSCLRLLDDFN